MSISILIWASLVVLAYCYAGYPLLIYVASLLKPDRDRRPTATELPTVSVILAVYNEEIVLRRSLDALVALEYPAASLEIMVGSDGSSDATNDILSEYSVEYPNVRAFLFEDRRGKIPVVNDLVRGSTGSILLFTDADVTLDPDTVQEHVAKYREVNVGGVAGNLILAGEQTVREGPLGSERYYMSIENVLRDQEARVHSTVGIFGGHYSILRQYWQELPNEPICDELYIGLGVISRGACMAFNSRAIAREHFGRSMADEFKRKSRFASRGLNTLRFFPKLLLPSAGWTATMLVSHKVLRWFTPFFLLIAFLATVGATLNGEAAAPVMLGVELGLAVIVVLGAIVSRIDRTIPILPHAYWFVTMNAAFALGTFRFIFKREQHFWAQTRRISVANAELPHMKEAAHS